METKWIRHPNLPGQETEVPAQSVTIYSHSGWEVMDEPPEWVTVKPETTALEELTTVAQDAAGMPESPAGRESRDADELQKIASEASGTDRTSDSKSAPGNDESDAETADKNNDKPAVKRSRRAPSKEDDQ
jgi:hypothetical protein